MIGQHAFLSGSKHSWIHYDEEKLGVAYKKFLAIRKGTAMHDFARKCIIYGMQLSRKKIPLNMYVNDAIKYHMYPEQVLFYSNNSFGTADTICFDGKLLRIHDLKTGASHVSMDQLEVYAALFCLEYEIKPRDIEIELRIYQTTEITIHVPAPESIDNIMKKIILFDEKIEKLRLEEELWLS